MFDIIKTALGSVFGGKTPQGESQILNSLTELLKGQKQKQREFELALEKEFQKRLDKEIEDRQSAREMQSEALRQSDLFSKRFLYYLSAGIMLGALIANLAPLFVVIPEESQVIVNKSMDFFNYVVAGGIISFFYGTKVNNRKNA